MGKSRLVYEFVHSHHTQGWLVLESASVSYGKATPYFPVIDLLKRYCHVEDARRHAHHPGQGDRAGADAGRGPPGHDPGAAGAPGRPAGGQPVPARSIRRSAASARSTALKRVLLRESQVQPLLLVFEDLHWIDTETQALLDSLVESLPTARLLLLVNYRPEYQHGWGSKTYYTQLRLDPLPPASADEFLQALLGDDPSLAPLTQLLIARTEGNPFFLEESVRTLVETGVLVGEPGAYRLAQALPTIQVPATVQAVLAARIDRLPPEEKRLLQTAAVIGTEVPLPLLQAIAELPEEALHRGLAHLQAAEFLYETRLFPEREYTFKHALTHEVAYGSLLQERRRVLHARIVEALEALAADRLAEQVERLAHHALRGEVWDKALAYCRQAGDEGHGALGLPRGRGVLRAGAQALAHLPEHARHARAGHRSPARPAHGARCRLATLGVSWRTLREAETLADGPRRPASAGTGLRLSVASISTSWARMTRPSPPASVPWRSPRPAGMSSCRRWRTSYLGVAYQAQGDYRRAIDCLRADRGVPRRGAAPRALRSGRPARRALPCLPRLVPCRAGHVRRGQWPRGRRAPDCRGGRSPREPHVCLIRGWSAVPPPRRPAPGHSPCSNGPGHLSGRGPPGLFPLDGCGLGCGVYPGRARRRRRAAAHAGDGAERLRRKRWPFQALCRLPLGEAQLLAGRLEEAHALAERAPGARP